MNANDSNDQRDGAAAGGAFRLRGGQRSSPTELLGLVGRPVGRSDATASLGRAPRSGVSRTEGFRGASALATTAAAVAVVGVVVVVAIAGSIWFVGGGNGSIPAAPEPQATSTPLSRPASSGPSAPQGPAGADGASGAGWAGRGGPGVPLAKLGCQGLLVCRPPCRTRRRRQWR